MELYDKLIARYPAEHFSVSTTQTTIEEESAEARLRFVTITHDGTEVLLVKKGFLEGLRTGKIQIAITPSVMDKICDGITAIDKNQHIIWYFELKSNCSANRCRDARQQILSSQEWFKAVLMTLPEILTETYQHVGVIATPPRTVEDIVKQRQRRKALTDEPNVERSRFFSALMAGNVRDEEHNIEFCHINGNEPVTLTSITTKQ